MTYVSKLINRLAAVGVLALAGAEAPTKSPQALPKVAEVAPKIEKIPPKGADKPVVDATCEQIIQGSLKWLASKQQADGAWAERQHEVAMTAYGLMAFMAAGNLPDEGPYGKNVAKAVKFLTDNQRADGYLIGNDEPGNDKGMYGHGIATIVLGEIYGQNKDAKLRGKLERAVKLIINTQNGQGGWRYFPRVADADISVTVLQVVALRAAKNDGLDVPQETMDKAVAYVRSCQSRDNSGGFGYQPHGKAGFARTAAAIYSLQVCGIYDSDAMVKAGSDYLIRNQGKDLTWFTYGNFYAAPAQYMMSDPVVWKNWYAGMRQILVERVKRQGDLCYWPPVAGDGSGQNEVYVTAVNTMILAMPYQYIPLYQK